MLAIRCLIPDVWFTEVRTVADFVAAIESGDSGPDADLLYFLSRSWGYVTICVTICRVFHQYGCLSYVGASMSTRNACFSPEHA